MYQLPFFINCEKQIADKGKLRPCGNRAMYGKMCYRHKMKGVPRNEEPTK